MDCELNILEKPITTDIQKVVELVTYQMGILPVGTFKYQIFKYPSDIDIFEEIETCCDFVNAKITAANNIQQIIQKIVNNKDAIFIDFKAGYDLRFKIQTGIINDEIIGYYPEIIKRDINNLFEAGLLSRNEKDKLIYLVKEEPNVFDVITLNEALRSYWVIRWTIEEILLGYKFLPGNLRIYLDDAVSQGSIVKLDIINYLEGRYTEISNFFLIAMKDKFGKRIILSEEFGEYGQSLLMDVYKYWVNNPLKSVKRLWMWLAFKQQFCQLTQFRELFESDIALYSQISGDLEVAIELLKPEFNKSMDQGQNSYKLLFDSINARTKLLNGVCVNLPIYKSAKYFELDIVSDNIKLLKDCLDQTVNKLVREWLEDNKIDIFELSKKF